MFMGLDQLLKIGKIRENGKILQIYKTDFGV